MFNVYNLDCTSLSWKFFSSLTMAVKIVENKKHEQDDNNSSDLKRVEDILEKIGGFSRFQVLAGLLLILPELPTAMITMSPLITGSTTLDHNDYSCAENTERNLTKKNFCHVISNCTDFDYVGTSTYTSIVTEWNLYCKRAWIVQMVTSMQMAGNTLGALIFPQLADRYGRRKIFFSVCFILGISGVVAGLAPNVAIFAILRFISGLSIGGLYLVYLNYLMEFLVPSCRTICGCVSFWAVGEMLLALLGYLIPGWRELSISVAIPLLVVPIFYTWLPESPRWLLCHNRTSEAADVFNQIAKWNSRPQVTFAQVQSVQDGIYRQDYKRVDPKNGLPNNSNWDINLSIFKPNPHRRQFLFLICLWFTMNLVYYGVSFNTSNLGGDLYLNVLFLGISELPGPFSGLLLNNYFGRRQSMLGFLLVGAIFFTSLLFLQIVSVEEVHKVLGINVNVESAGKVLVLCGRYCVAASFAIMACATAESFPTSQRLTFAGTCAFFGNVGGILAPQIVFLETVWPVAPYIGFSCLSILLVLLCFGLKETSGMPLSDSAENVCPQIKGP